MSKTKTDRAASEWAIEDDVIRLHLWGSDLVYLLPAPPVTSLVMGSAETCGIQLVDPSGLTSREHARLERSRRGWAVHDLDSKNGIRIDGARRPQQWLQPGVEIGIGGLTLIAESRRFIELRNFVARLLGWTSDKAPVVDLALRAIRMAATRRAPLVLCGSGDLTPIALAIHRRALGSDRPFVVSDPRRREGRGSVRAAENTESGMAALARARGGSLCIRSKRVPRDFAEVRLALREPDARVQLIVCVETRRQGRPYHVEPIVVPTLRSRSEEIPRIIAEFAEDAAGELAAAPLSMADRGWVLKYSSSSLSDIEKGTRRLVALRHHRDNAAAAARMLGMSAVSLLGWIGRRALPGTSPSPISRS